MASRCLGVNTLLHLPSALRSSIYANANARAFSSTPQRKVDIGSSTLTSIVVSVPTAVLDGVHSLGLPWCAAIPVTALLVRGVFGYYYAARPARQRATARLNLYPLIHARFKAEISNKMGEYEERRRAKGDERLSPLGQKLNFAVMSVMTRYRETNQVSKAYGLRRFAPQNWINFVVLIAFAEAVRIKCGAREGLLTLLLGPLQQLRKSAAGETTAAGESSAAEAVADPVAAAKAAAMSRQEQLVSLDTMPDGNLLASQHQLSQLNMKAPAYADLTDPAMTVEGFSWLQDLTVPDTTFMLPAALGFFMIANTLLRPSFKKTPDTIGDIQEKLKALDESIKQDNQSTLPKASSRKAQSELPKIETATDDVLNALAVAEKVSMQTPKKRNPSAGPLADLSFGKRVGLLFSMLLFFATMNFPAGVVLYMLSSMGIGWLQGRWLDVRYPMRPPITPCRRPMRYKVKKEYMDT